VIAPQAQIENDSENLQDKKIAKRRKNTHAE
jgi:hypothetical protein